MFAGCGTRIRLAGQLGEDRRELLRRDDRGFGKKLQLLAHIQSVPTGHLISSARWRQTVRTMRSDRVVMAEANSLKVAIAYETMTRDQKGLCRNRRKREQLLEGEDEEMLRKGDAQARRSQSGLF